MKSRIIKLLESEQLSPSRFAEIIGVQRSAISHILSGRNQPSLDMLSRILKYFPSLSAEWLFRGTEPMYLNDLGTDSPTDNTPSKPTRELEQLTYTEPIKLDAAPEKSSKIIPTDTSDTFNKIIVCYPDQTFEVLLKR